MESAPKDGSTSLNHWRFSQQSQETAVGTANPSRAPSISTRLHETSLLCSRCETARYIDVEKQTYRGSSDDDKGKDKAKDNSNLVAWDGPNDPENAQNLPRHRKWLTTISASLLTFSVSFASSVFSTATNATAEEFGVSSEVMILGVSLYVLGFAAGPLIWGPASEVWGRRRPMLIGFTLFAILQIPVAVAQNLETIFLSRFLAGCFGAAPLAIVPGMQIDFWTTVDRGVSQAVYAAAVFMGPCLGPVIGSFITESYLGWRWTAWITLIMSALFGVLALFVIPETYPLTIHTRKAVRLRLKTKNWALHSKREEEPVQPRDLLQKYFSRPFVMLVKEPILLVLTVYLSFVYSLLYLTFFAYPYSFEVFRGWRPGVASLPFLGILVGLIIACFVLATYTKTRFARIIAESNKSVIPEARLPPMILGSIVLPIGLFWFAWTSSPDITWIPQVLSGSFIGCGILLIFLPGLLYIADTYQSVANSAYAINAFCRAAMAAGFPLFANYMYSALGVGWATSILGFVAVALVPFPILFYTRGEKIRAKGKFDAS